MERLEEQLQDVQPYREKYYELRVEKAAVDEKLKGSKLNDVLAAICLSAGSAGIGAASKYFTLDQLTGAILLAVSSILVVAGIVAKVVK